MAFTEYQEVITNSSALQPILVSVNSNLVNGLLGVAILIALFIIISLRLMRNNTTIESITTASFLSVIIGSLLWVIGILPIAFVIFFIFITVIALVIMYTNNNA